MAANGLAVSYTDLKGEVALALDINRTVASWTSAEISDFARVNKEGLNQFYFPPPLQNERVGHVWSFLRPKAPLTINAPYSTGTVTIVAGVATLAGGTWPTWAAAGTLIVANVRYPVNIRGSGSSITLNDTTVAASAGTSYQLVQLEYDLASDFGGMESNAFTYTVDQPGCGEIKIVHEGDLRRADRLGNSSASPMYACVVPVASDATTDTRWQVIFSSYFSVASTLEYRYAAIPPLLDGSTYVYHYGGAPYSRAVVASYIDVAFQKIRDSFEKHDAFLEALRQAVMYDRANHAVHTFGQGVRSYGPQEVGLGNYLTNRRRLAAGITFDSLV